MLDKDARSWDRYIKTEADLSDEFVMRAVNGLQNPALCDRHWLDSSMALALNLYRYENEVKNIVDKAINGYGKAILS